MDHDVALKEIKKDGFTHLVKDSDSFKELLDMVRDDLYNNYSSLEFYNKYHNLLSKSLIDYQNDRSADMFCIVERNRYIGILLIHYYNWHLISSQICYQFDYSYQYGCYLTMAKFSNLLPYIPDNIKQVAEIATIWVHPLSRRQGIGLRLFNHSLTRIKTRLSNQDYFFIAAASKISPENCENILNLFKSHKETLSKRSSIKDLESHYVKLPVKNINNLFGIDEEDYGIRNSSRSIERFAVREDMKYIGHFKTFSKIFGSYIC